MKGPLEWTEAELAVLESIQRRVLWLSTYLVHHANFIRPNPDGTKVGGHQASSTSAVSLMTALYFKLLRAGDCVAIKPHASPVFYAIQFLRGELTEEALRQFRSLGGLQAYPSRRKNPEIVDLSTGSMGLGAVAATFGALATRYLTDRFGTGRPERFIVMVGDAELDEGNVWEALAEEVVSRLGNVLWIVDANRQSLDRITPDIRARQIRELFAVNGWRVIELAHGSRLGVLLERPGGERLRQRLDGMPNAEYQSLLRLPATAVRKVLITSPDGSSDPVLDRLLGEVSDEELKALVSDVGGHDLKMILEAFQEAEAQVGRPTVILARTIKGWGLPFAGDPLNHTMLLTQMQIEELRSALGIAPGAEWARFPPGSPEAEHVARLEPLFRPPGSPARVPLEIPEQVESSYPALISTQEAFGRVMSTLARTPLAERLVTVSADVAVTTHLGGWINRRGVYFPEAKPNFFDQLPQAVAWREGPTGHHIELGISEHNLFLLLAAFGLTAELSGEPLFPVGTLYDPFIGRGLDALYHALYSGAKFILVATPSGVSLSPEGGAHQSVITPSIGIELPGLVCFDPPFAREVEWILLAGLSALTRRLSGESLYLRLSTKPVVQGLAPPSSAEYRAQVLRGAYRLIDRRGDPGYEPGANVVHVFAVGAMVPEAVEASRALAEQGILANVFAVTSPDLLYRGFAMSRRAERGSGRVTPHLERLLSPEEAQVPAVTVLDGHSHTLAFIGAALGVPQVALGVDSFGESGARDDLYRRFGIDADAIAQAAHSLLA
ncbi:MAG: 1-deoxy-D-xylulose-5-phosphate synthase N-terminal domain-containing protein [Candidatus Methylomirabilia bacterium]